MTVKPEFQPLIDDLRTQGFGQWIYESEFWWVDSGLETLAKRTAKQFASWANDKEAGITTDEKQYAQIVWKHFPQVKEMAQQIQIAKEKTNL